MMQEILGVKVDTSTINEDDLITARNMTAEVLATINHELLIKKLCAHKYCPTLPSSSK